MSNCNDLERAAREVVDAVKAWTVCADHDKLHLAGAGEIIPKARKLDAALDESEGRGGGNAGEFCPYCEQYRVYGGRCRGCRVQFGVSYFDNEPDPEDAEDDGRGEPVDVVAAVRRDDNGCVWLCRRDSSGRHGGLAGMWEYPGGKVEEGEQLHDALRRELREEFGNVEPEIGRALDSITTHGYRVTFFRVKMDDPEELRDHTEARWMEPEEACATEHLPSGTIFNARHLARPTHSDADPSGVEEYAERHDDRWQDEDDDYWLARLQQEVAELTLALDGEHDDPPEHELRQIGSICVNWLHRLRRTEDAGEEVEG